MEISFYHLTSSSLEAALPKLMEKVYGSGKRALIAAENDEKTEEFNRILWTYHPQRFLPHGSNKDGNEADQPVFLCSSRHMKNPNNAEILVITDGSKPGGLEGFSRVLDIFDGNNADSLQQARTRWKQYKSEAMELSYFQQDAKGKWEKAEV